MKQADLFGRVELKGLDYAQEFITQREHEQLVAKLNSLDLEPFRFHGWTGNRKTRTFGWRYDFDDASFTPAAPIPPWLRSLQAKVAEFAGVDSGDVAHVLIARYDPGAAIGWHRDRPQFEQVVGISLVSEAILRFRQRIDGGFRRSKLYLEPRSAYLLSSEARWEWEHSIAAAETLRFSITFRTLSAKGRLAAGKHL
jgi:alkylated DNA repair dioxygenase AlkB